MTWEIKIIQKIKDDVVIIDGKDKFEHLPQGTPAKAIAIAIPSHLNSSAFHY